MRSLIAAALIMIAVPASAQQPTDARDVIVTTGEAVVRRAPDVAYVTVAVEKRAQNPRDAQRQNADTMAAVVRRLGEAGVARDALRTVGLRLAQEFDNANGKRVPRDFLARNSLEITVDVNRSGEIADAAVQAGATALDDIRFDVRDRVSLEREAMRLAVVDARARCEILAAAAGRAVDRVLKIELRSDSIVRPQQMRMASVDESIAVTDVEPGLIEIRAEVLLTASMR